MLKLNYTLQGKTSTDIEPPFQMAQQFKQLQKQVYNQKKDEIKGSIVAH